MENYGIYNFKIRTYECSPNGEATLPSILNLLQEAASVHAEELGFSKSNFASSGLNISWVLTRMKVEMFSYPKWEDTISIKTWPSGGRKITAWRDFEILDSKNNIIGKAISEWMIIDLTSRKITPIPELVIEKATPRKEPVVFEKLKWQSTANDKPISFRAKRSDLDLNGHVNNVHYVEWLLETTPENIGRCKEFEIVFKSETFAGMKVNAYAQVITSNTFMHCISDSEGKEHVIAKTVWE